MSLADVAGVVFIIAVFLVILLVVISKLADYMESELGDDDDAV